MEYDKKIDIDKDGKTDIEVKGAISSKGIFLSIIPEEKLGKIVMAILAILATIGIGKLLGM